MAKRKREDEDEDTERDDDAHHEDAYRDGGRIKRGTSTQRAALHQHRKNRAKD